MPVLKGITSGSIKSTAYNIPCTIKSIGVYNRHTSAIVVNIGVSASGTDTFFKSYNLAATGTSGSSDLTLTDIRVAANMQILVAASGSCNYYITIDTGEGYNGT